TKPEMIENKVVLPAPLGPMRAVTRCGCAASEAASTALSPPNQQDTRSTASSASGIRSPKVRLPDRPHSREKLPRIGDSADQPSRHDPDHDHEHGPVDDEIEAGRIADYQPCHLAERLDDQRPGQGPEDGSNAANN